MDKNDFRQDLKQDVKLMRRNKVVSAILFVVIGVVLLAWPGETLMAVSKAVGLVLAVGGVAAVVVYFYNGAKAVFSYAGLIGGVIVGVLGLWLFFNPSFLISLIPTIVGIILIISGLVNLSEGLALKKSHDESVLITIVLAAISIVLGIFILLFQLQFAALITRLMGIALVYDGVTDLVMISKLTGIVRTVEYAARQAVQDANPLDVTATVKDVTPEEPEKEEAPDWENTTPEEATVEEPTSEETEASVGEAAEEAAEEPAEDAVEETPAEEPAADDSLVAAPEEFESEDEEPAEAEEPTETEETPAEAEETPTEETPSETETLFEENSTEE